MRDGPASTTFALNGRVGRGWFRLTAAMAIAAAAAGVSAAGALTLAGYLLPIDAAAEPVDALVVLGGFAVPRADLAARLYVDRKVALVVVTGAGDCGAMSDTLVAHDVPTAAVVSECASRSTIENARYSASILRSRGVSSARLVTHWYHARRALAAFRAAAPEIEFSAASVTPERTPRWLLGWRDEPRAALDEYGKIAWYALAYGVFTRLLCEPATAEARQ